MSAPTQPLTRRQRRDAERAAEAAAARAQQSEAQGNGAAQVGSVNDAERIAEIPAVSERPGATAVDAPADASSAPAPQAHIVVPPVPVATAQVAVEACAAVQAYDPTARASRCASWEEIIAADQCCAESVGATRDLGATLEVDTAAVSRLRRKDCTRPAGPDSRRRVAEAHSHRALRRRPSSMATRAGVMGVLGVVTIVAPLASSTSVSTVAASALGLSSGTAAQAATPTAEPEASMDSVAATVLSTGSDADVDEASSDASLRNVPDAATRSRIREAYENAAVTCSPTTTAASGDAAAFNTMPSVFYPMLPGTYSVSSPYGWRLHPTLGYLKLHAGQDFAAPTGTPIYAVAAGTVTTAGMRDGVGTITIKHEIDGETWYTSYLHMYADGIYVSVGDQVSAGQLIAGVGNTGRSTGAHLHFEVRTADDSSDDTTVDPEAWLESHRAVQLSTDCS